MFRLWRIVSAVTVFAVIPPAALAVKREPSKPAANHPELVLISARDERTHKVMYCSGALIAPRAVLTAAHCVKGFDRWEVTAPNAKRQRSTAKVARVHPRFQPGKYAHDLAILILDEPIRTDTFPTLHGGDLLRLETKLVVIGRTANGKVSSDQLFRAGVTLVGTRFQDDVYGGNPRVSEKGDSGGPVFVAGREKEIVAVVSGGLGQSRANVPTDVYVPITRAERDWILRQVPKDR